MVMSCVLLRSHTLSSGRMSGPVVMVSAAFTYSVPCHTLSRPWNSSALRSVVRMYAVHAWLYVATRYVCSGGAGMPCSLERRNVLPVLVSDDRPHPPCRFRGTKCPRVVSDT